MPPKPNAEGGIKVGIATRLPVAVSVRCRKVRRLRLFVFLGTGFFMVILVVYFAETGPTLPWRRTRLLWDSQG